MSSGIDFRVDVGLPDHPKWLGMRERCGSDGQVCIIHLWAWARMHRPNGDLAGLGVEAIETAARWRGRAGRLHAALLALTLLSPDGKIHGWQDRNGYASGQASRSYAGKVGGILKQALKAGLTPERYLRLQGGEQAQDTALLEDLGRAYAAHVERKKGPRQAKPGSLSQSGLATHSPTVAQPTAPCPSPTPSPTPTPTPKEGRGRGLADATDVPATSAAPPGDEQPPTPPACARCRDAGQVPNPAVGRSPSDPGAQRRPLFVPCPECRPKPGEGSEGGGTAAVACSAPRAAPLTRRPPGTCAPRPEALS